MRQARDLIATSPGFLSIDVRAAAEAADRYLLRVEWTDLSAHREGFRKSKRYKEWRALLHRFYQPMPSIEYFGESIL